MITAKEISLCKIKLKQQKKSEEKLNKNEFGMFCSQLGFSEKETKPPSKLSSSKQCKKRQVSLDKI